MGTALIESEQDFTSRRDAMIQEKTRVAREQLEYELAHPLETHPLTKKRRDLFLKALATGLAVTECCAIAAVGRTTVYAERRRNPEFAKLWDDALDASCERLEASLEEVAHLGSVDSMARVRAVETLLRGRSARYRNGNAGPTTAKATLTRSEDGGSISVAVSTPGPD